MAFPLRAAYRLRPSGQQPVRFLISIPKKRIHKAVERVLLRRRTRESYRLNRNQLLVPALQQADCGVDIAFVYLDKTPAPYQVIDEKMISLLERIAKAAADHSPEPSQQPGS
jgi:ribonuclease P protein component